MNWMFYLKLIIFLVLSITQFLGIPKVSKDTLVIMSRKRRITDFDMQIAGVCATISTGVVIFMFYILAFWV